MSNKKIKCGGFEIDNETIIEENGVLKSVGDNPANMALIVGSAREGNTITLDKTWQQICDGNYIAINEIDDTDVLFRMNLIIIRIAQDNDYVVEAITYNSKKKEIEVITFSSATTSGYPSVTFE